MSSEVSPEQARRILDMLTEGGAMDDINTPLADASIYFAGILGIPTSILPRDVFFPKTPIVSSAITRTKTRNSTQRVLPLRFQFLSPEPRYC